MNTDRLVAALIRAFWTFVFPMLGALVAWLANGENLQNVGFENAALASIVAALLYGVKKLVWPDTKF